MIFRRFAGELEEFPPVYVRIRAAEHGLGGFRDLQMPLERLDQDRRYLVGGALQLVLDLVRRNPPDREEPAGGHDDADHDNHAAQNRRAVPTSRKAVAKNAEALCPVDESTGDIPTPSGVEHTGVLQSAHDKGNRRFQTFPGGNLGIRESFTNECASTEIQPQVCAGIC